MTPEQVAFYRDQGFVVLSGVFPEVECDRLLYRIRRHANADFAAIMNPDRVDFLARQSSPEAQIWVGETAPVLRLYMGWPDMVTCLETLQGRPVVGLMSQMLFKEAGTRYARQAWNPHQDNTYPRNENKQYITTNLFLADADKENGSLYIYPGSHREPLLPTVPHVSYREPDGSHPGDAVEVPPGYVRQDLSFRKGDVLVMNGNVIHGSYANSSPTRARPMYSCSYISAGESFIPGANAQRMVIPLR